MKKRYINAPTLLDMIEPGIDLKEFNFKKKLKNPRKKCQYLCKIFRIFIKLVIIKLLESKTICFKTKNFFVSFYLVESSDKETQNIKNILNNGVSMCYGHEYIDPDKTDGRYIMCKMKFSRIRYSTRKISKKFVANIYLDNHFGKILAKLVNTRKLIYGKRIASSGNPRTFQSIR